MSLAACPREGPPAGQQEQRQGDEVLSFGHSVRNGNIRWQNVTRVEIKGFENVSRASRPCRSRGIKHGETPVIRDNSNPFGKGFDMSQEKKPAVVLLSGGLDSATALAIAQHEGFAIHAMSFRYGQARLRAGMCQAHCAKGCRNTARCHRESICASLADLPSPAAVLKYQKGAPSRQ